MEDIHHEARTFVMMGHTNFPVYEHFYFLGIFSIDLGSCIIIGAVLAAFLAFWVLGSAGFLLFYFSSLLTTPPFLVESVFDTPRCCLLFLVGCYGS